MQQDDVSRRTVLAIGAAAGLSFMGIMIETSLNVAFPTMIEEFSVPLSTLQWLTTGYLLSVTLMMSVSAHLLTRLSPRTLFIAAESACIAGTLLCATAPNFPLLLTGRVMQAIATGLATPVMFHIIFSQVPLRRLGTFVGGASMVISLAPALGPTYGGLLTHALSWRMIFWFALIPALALLPLGVTTIRVHSSPAKSRFDIWGFILLGVALFGIIETVTQLGEWNVRSWRFPAVAAATVAAVVLLARHVAAGRCTILNFHLLRDRVVGPRAMNYFILQFTNIGISFVIPIFAQNVLHANALTAGLMLLPGSLIGAAVAPVAGGIYDRRGPRRVLITADVTMLTGTVLFACFTDSLSPLFVTGLYIFLRLGFNIGFGTSMSDAVKQSDPSRKGEINALFNTFQQYAGSLGTASLSAIITLSQLASGADGTADQAMATARGSRIDFALLAVLCLAALLTTVISTRRLANNGSD